MTAGSLVVAGTGIKLVAEAGVATEKLIRAADEVLFVAGDPARATWLTQLNPVARSLHSLYKPGRPRIETYRQMVAEIMAAVRAGRAVCAVFYGHPGVFVWPAREAIRQARAAGYPARMIPAVSAEDCLYADLGLNPLTSGCQRFEATNFLLYERRFDPRCPLILWQIAAIGEPAFRPEPDNKRGLELLVESLLAHYPPTHEVIIYEAASYAILEPQIESLALAALPQATVSHISTLYVPPVGVARPDEEMAGRIFPDRE